MVNHSALYRPITETFGVDQLHQQDTIGILPDDVLLKVFRFFIGTANFNGSPSEKWHTLVHVCRRWRDLALSSPRHLDLQLLCRPPKRSVRETLEIWPKLPIYIHDFHNLTGDATDNIAAALRLNHRVSGIQLERISDRAWETFGPLMQKQFPSLTHLWLGPHLKDAIPRSFLDGSAPCLRALVLIGVSFPALPELLLSATNLVRLWYDSITGSGYISPQAMVAGLSTLTRLESLSLTFQPFQDLQDRTVRIPPPHTRTLLPALTILHFRGVPEYMEDLIAQFDTPSLESMEITLFHQEVLEVSELAKFVRRADRLSSADRAAVAYMSDRISVRLAKKLMGVGAQTLELELLCHKSQFRLSYLVQLCVSCLPNPSPFDCLLIQAQQSSWRDAIGDLGPQWLDLLCPFSNVKRLRLAKHVAYPVAQALGGLQAERVLEVLPALEIVFMSELEPFGPVKEAISEFSDMRQLFGHPVYIHWKEAHRY